MLISHRLEVSLEVPERGPLALVHLSVMLCPSKGRPASKTTGKKYFSWRKPPPLVFVQQV